MKDKTSKHTAIASDKNRNEVHNRMYGRNVSTCLVPEKNPPGSATVKPGIKTTYN